MTDYRQSWGPAHFQITGKDGATKIITVKGRVRWALENLMYAGETGCTPIDHPGPRWSAYVCVLRHDFDVEIETIHEKHGAPFEGTHARYIARCDIKPVVSLASGEAA